jgi:hypothetical protein
MRESLIAGVPVWATASAGIKDLMDNCKKGEVKLLDLSKSDVSLDKDFKSLLSSFTFCSLLILFSHSRSV